MGCTSSTPNMVTASANPTGTFAYPDKILHFSKDAKDEKSNCERDGNETIEKVLPTCDTLGESIKLDRSNKSLNASNVQVGKGANSNGHIMAGDNTLMYQEDSQVEEKFSSLEDVVEKVVELYIADNTVDDGKNIPESSTELQHYVDQNSKSEKSEKMFEVSSKQISHVETEPSELIEEKIEEAISPSQSTSSRATRWEALADIAAELPPSLAVDPVTGQIYALSKFPKNKAYVTCDTWISNMQMKNWKPSKTF